MYKLVLKVFTYLLLEIVGIQLRILQRIVGCTMLQCLREDHIQ